MVICCDSGVWVLSCMADLFACKLLKHFLARMSLTVIDVCLGLGFLPLWNNVFYYGGNS